MKIKFMVAVTIALMHLVSNEPKGPASTRIVKGTAGR